MSVETDKILEAYLTSHKKTSQQALHQIEQQGDRLSNIVGDPDFSVKDLRVMIHKGELLNDAGKLLKAFKKDSEFFERTKQEADKVLAGTATSPPPQPQ
jgi:hypothetical protein